MDEDTRMANPNYLQLFVITIVSFALSACVDHADIPSPSAFDDEFSVATGSSGTLLNVLENDICDCSLTIVSVDGPSDAGSSTAAISGNQIEFTPDPALTNGAQATFTYIVENPDGDTATATVTVTMQGNTTPMPSDDAFTVSTGSSNNVFDVLSNDSCDCTLTITEVEDPAGASDTAINNGQIEYTPDPALAGGAVETFTYTVENDDGDSATATVTVTLVAGPTANGDALAISKNSPHNTIDVLDNDSISTGTKAIDSFDTSSINGGRVWLHSDGLQLVYQPPLNSLAEDTFTYTLTDGLATATATVTVTATDHVAGTRPCETEAAARQAAGRPYCFDVLVQADTGETPINHQIAATVFVPADGGDSKPPVLMHAHGFGESRFADLENPNQFMVNRVTAQSLLELWHEGYWVVSYDQRGFNASNLWGPTADSSNGQCSQAGDPECIDVLNPEREGRDMATMVDWIVGNLREGYEATLEPAAPAPEFTPPAANAAPLYDDSDGDVVLGTIGLSYGGGFQTIGAGVEQALNGMSKINAMVPVTTWFDFRYSLFQNDVPKSGWIQFLTAATQTGGTTLAPNGFLSEVGQEALALDNVSTATYNGLYLRSPRAYCENRGDSAIGTYADGDTTLQPSEGTTPAPSIPSVFVIQGQRDVLFNYNEALDLAECYENAGSPDVRMLIQTEGHILSTAQPASYRGEGEVIYIDEEIYCDAAGADKLMTRELISGWFRSNLGAPAVPEAFLGANQIPPKVCTTHFLTSAAPLTGNTFNSFAEIPVGDTSGDGSYTFSITSDGTDGGDQVSFDLPGAGPETPLHQQTLITATSEVIISGIPLLKLDVSGNGSPSPNDDARFFVKLAVIRAGEDTANVIADQETPISGAAPTAGPDCFDPNGGCPISFSYPDDGRHYPEQLGDAIDPNDGSLQDAGRIVGISVKLAAGDQLVLQLFDQTAFYNLHGTNPGRYSLTIESGSIQIPVVQ